MGLKRAGELTQADLTRRRKSDVLSAKPRHNSRARTGDSPPRPDLIALLVYLANYLKIAPSCPGLSVQRLAPLHLAELKYRFYDATLNVNVDYAKHAISIDENREDFARVGWSPTAEKQDKRDAAGNLYFEQI